MRRIQLELRARKDKLTEIPQDFFDNLILVEYINATFYIKFILNIQLIYLKISILIFIAYINHLTNLLKYISIN